MTYHLVYDAATVGYQGWMFLAGGGFMTLLGSVLVFAPEFKRMQGGARVFCWSFFLFALVLTILVAWSTLVGYLDLRRAFLLRQCDEVVGIVSDFVPKPDTKRGMESFSVSGVHFEYSDIDITGGFNRTASYGGPIREGLPVRICYVHRSITDENIIVRLEIAR